MSAIAISVTAMDLPLVHVFKIARGEEAVARTALVRVRAGDREGLGEATPVERYGESVESVIAYFDAHPPAGDDPFALETLLDARIPAAARAGLDIALHDLIGKQLGKPLYALLGLDPSQTPTTSFTIGIAKPDEMLRKVDEAAQYPILKVKVGGGAPADDVEMIAAIRARYRGAIRIDANEGWTVNEAITTLREMQRYEIEFCEQPVPAGNPQWLRAIRERVRHPDRRRRRLFGRKRPPAAERLHRRRQRKASKDRWHSRRARDDPYRAGDGFESHARLYGRERHCRKRRRASLAARRLGRY